MQQVVSTPKPVTAPVVDPDPIVVAPEVISGAPEAPITATEVTPVTLETQSFQPNETSKVYGYNPMR